MAMLLLLMFLAIASQGHAGGETPGELYWQAKLGDIPLPKVIKDSLLPPGVGDAAQELQAMQTTNNKNNKINVVHLYDDGIRHNTKNNRINGAYVYDDSIKHNNKNNRINGAYVYDDSVKHNTKNNKINGAYVYDNSVKHNNKNKKINGAHIYDDGVKHTDKNNIINGVFGNYGSVKNINKNNIINSAYVYDDSVKHTTKNNRINGAYVYDDSVELLHDDKSGFFFLEKDLTHIGSKIKLRFMTNDDGSKFLPPNIAQQIPFSSTKLPKIPSLFSVKPKSEYAQTMEDTIKMCEAKAINGENKLCTSSLEGMVDYAMSKLGNHVMVYSTKMDKDVLTEYSVEGSQKISNGDNVVCHKMSYPYAVFTCHSQKDTDTYIVSLADSNGKKNKAVVVCHKDTSSWNPGHFAFQILKVKPGSMPICHVINQLSVAFVSY